MEGLKLVSLFSSASIVPTGIISRGGHCASWNIDWLTLDFVGKSGRYYFEVTETARNELVARLS